MEEAEQTKVKSIHSADTLRNHWNIYLNINNKRQDCKIGTVGGTSGRGKGK
jgi:hypothetical protein